MQNIDSLTNLFNKAIKNCIEAGLLNIDEASVDPGLERPRDESNGDFASTIALRLAKQAKMNPRQIAQLIVDNFPDNDEISSFEIAGPGFINLRLNNSAICSIIEKVRNSGENFALNCGKDLLEDINQKINLEYISANPTGPMHVGHGR